MRHPFHRSRRTPALPDPQMLAAQIAGGRVVIAAGLIAAPTTLIRVLGADAATAARVTWLTRMMATRDAAIGAGALIAVRRSGDPGPWLIAGAVSDAADAVVVTAALRTGRLRGAVPALVAPLAAALGVTGAYVATRVSRA